MVIFFLIAGLLVITLICYLVSCKYLVAAEFIIPAYGIYLTLFCLPSWIEKPLEAKFFKGDTLAQTITFIFILNFFLVFFSTSHYSISFLGRAFLIANSFNLSLRKWASGDSDLIPPLFNFFMVTLFMEVHSYVLNLEKVKLFLEKEASK